MFTQRSHDEAHVTWMLFGVKISRSHKREPWRADTEAIVEGLGSHTKNYRWRIPYQVLSCLLVCLLLLLLLCACLFVFTLVSHKLELSGKRNLNWESTSITLPVGKDVINFLGKWLVVGRFRPTVGCVIPRWCKKVSWLSHGEWASKQRSSMTSASISAFRFSSWAPALTSLTGMWLRYITKQTFLHSVFLFVCFSFSWGLRGGS